MRPPPQPFCTPADGRVFESRLWPAYVAAQLIGAAVGGLLAGVVVPSIGFPAPSASMQSCLIAEVVLTFALCHTVLHTATVGPAKNGMYYGLAIGFTVLSGAVSVGGISGGAFNPAVGVLTALAGAADTTAIVVYTLGPLLGGALAGEIAVRSHLTHSAPLLHHASRRAPLLSALLCTVALSALLHSVHSPSPTPKIPLRDRFPCLLMSA